MKVLSLQQPWATLMALVGHPDPITRMLAKKIETRSFQTKYRGPLAIHASKTIPAEVRTWLVTTPEGARSLLALETAGYGQLSDLPLGKILCVCDLVGCGQFTAENAPPEPELSFGDYTPGRWAWYLDNVRMLCEPIPAKGMLGLWTPAPEVLVVLKRIYEGGA